jgi:hypothetical protein
MKTLPLDRSRAFDPSNYPRRPSRYSPLPHFLQRFKERKRFLNGKVIYDAVTKGDLRDNGDGCACFRKVWGAGVAYYLIVGFHEEGHLVYVTAWPHLHHREPALNSGLWSPTELDAIEALNEQYQTRFADHYPEYDEWLQQNEPDRRCGSQKKLDGTRSVLP